MVTPTLVADFSAPADSKSEVLIAKPVMVVPYAACVMPASPVTTAT